MCSFPVRCLGQDVNSIVSVPDHCIFIYFSDRPFEWQRMRVLENLKLHVSKVSLSHEMAQFIVRVLSIVLADG